MSPTGRPEQISKLLFNTGTPQDRNQGAPGDAVARQLAGAHGLDEDQRLVQSVGVAVVRRVWAWVVLVVGRCRDSCIAAHS